MTLRLSFFTCKNGTNAYIKDQDLKAPGIPAPFLDTLIPKIIERVQSPHFTYDKTEAIMSSIVYKKGLSSTPSCFFKHYTRLLTFESLNEA